MKNFELNKFYSFKIKDRKLKELGFLIAEGEDWYLIHDLFADYVMNGYLLLNKAYVLDVCRDEDILFKEKVLFANDEFAKPPSISPPLSFELLFDWLEEEQLVFQIENGDESRLWIGKIVKSTDKSIFLKDLDPKGCWSSSYFTFRKKNIRMISFDSLYMNALLKYSLTLDDSRVDKGMCNE